MTLKTGTFRPPTDRFVRLSRDPKQALDALDAPRRVVRTIKQPGDIII